MERADNIDSFNTIVGLIFAQLYRNFPVACPINEPAIIQGLGFTPKLKSIEGFDKQFVDGWPELPGGVNSFELYDAALRWLAEEHFVRHGNGNFVLTAAALAALSATPGSLDKPLGRRINDVVTNTAGEAGRTALAAIVTQVVAVVGKGFFS